MRYLTFSVSLFKAIAFSTLVNAASCPLDMQVTQSDHCNRDESGDCNRTVVFGKSAIVFSEQMRVNTDGNIRSYSAKDPSGSLCARLPANADPYENGCAMNTICNGVHVRYRDGKKLRGTGTPNSNTEVNCGKLVREFKRIRDDKWLPTDKSEVVWGNVIRAQAATGRPAKMPCMVKDFMVSMASAKSGLARRNRCDKDYYLNSDVPSVVVPVCWSKEYRTKEPEICEENLSSFELPDVLPGDLAVIRLRKSPAKLIYALVGDAGPAHKLGEASVGLHWRLRDHSGLPRTKAKMYDLDNDDLFDVVIFPGSRPEDVTITPENFKQTAASAKKQFLNWARGNLENGIEQFTACSLKSRQN